MKKVIALCSALVICAAMMASVSTSQTTRSKGGWNGEIVSGAATFNASTTFNSDVQFNSSVSGLDFARTSHSHSASDIVSGTFDTARIPSLDASKITTGTFSPAQLGSGSPNSTVFLRGDGAWAAPSGLPTVTTLTADATVTNSTSTVTAMTSSPSSIAVGDRLEFEGVLNLTPGSSTTGLKVIIQLLMAGSPTVTGKVFSYALEEGGTVTGGTTVGTGTGSQSITIINSGSASDATIRFRVFCRVTGTAGGIQLNVQFAQNTAGANTITMREGSVVKLNKI